MTRRRKDASPVLVAGRTEQLRPVLYLDDHTRAREREQFLMNPTSRSAPAYHADVRARARSNSAFRRVLFTGPNLQVVAMALTPGEDIGEESHPVDQCFFFVQGSGRAVVAGRSTAVGDDGLCVPANTRHNIINTGDGPLKLYTTYAPPQHPAGTVHRSKADAQRAEHSEMNPTGGRR